MAFVCFGDTGRSDAEEPSCPVCSRYDYEVQLLERVLSNEMALKNTLDKMTETHSKVEDTLKAIKAENIKLNDAMTELDIKKKDIDTKLASAIQAGMTQVFDTVSEMKTTVQAIVQETESKMQVLEDKVSSFIEIGFRNVSETFEEMTKSVQSLVAQTATEINVTREKSVAPLVMFSAQLFHYDSQYTLTVSHDIVFQYILVNEGRAYNSANGRFTASVAGVYMFTVQYCPYTNKKIYLDIVHAGRSLQCSTNWERDDIVCASMQAFAKVAVGDTISVRSRHSGILYHNSNSWNSFSGLLIRV